MMSSFMEKGFGAVRDEQYSAEIESLFQKTEFESKQLLKSIEYEKGQIASIKKQLELRPKQIKEMEEETRRCEEEVKGLHRQYTQTVAACETMRKQGVQLDEEIEKQRNKLEAMVKETARWAVEYDEKLEKYKAIWKSYEQKYMSNPKVKELKELQQTVEKLTVKNYELKQKRETLERKLNDLTTTSNTVNRSQKPRWTDWFVKLASIKLETMTLQNECAEIHQAKLKALEEKKFLDQKLASLKAKQLAKESSLQVVDKVVYEAPQEQYEGEAGNDAAAEVIPDDTPPLVNPTQDQRLATEYSSSESSQQFQQMPQFTFTDNNTNSEAAAVATAFSITPSSSSEPVLSQGGFNFSGFGEDFNIPQQGVSTGLQFSSESNPSTIFGHFSFTSPRVGGSGEEGTTGMSCFGSPASVASGGQDNFFLFSGNQTSTQTPTKDSSNVFNLF